MSVPLDIDPQVAETLRQGGPVVALESTVIAHGLPWPGNLETAQAMEAQVREAGAVPATIGLIAGQAIVGMSADQIEGFAREGGSMAKLGSRDLGPAMAQGLDGATTVSATARLAALAGIGIFATGGIGGAHRDCNQTFDISADLMELSRSPVAVVASGAKSILDLPRTLEILESLSVPVVGLGGREFPAFYAVGSGLPLDHSVGGARDAAELLRAHWQVSSGGLLLAQPVPEAAALSGTQLDGWIENALQDATRENMSGKAVTPFLLSRLHEMSAGATLAANRALLLSNAAMAGRIAAAWAA
ncbi:pseudouridine-5'-phosphate glycosidase [Fodinicurvata fenggangensis]|uniref:pseudouridine-5'-phosphate glycosidase n=1 Tax=Fodinicurvata fenggangensis TaxID=1121830 RepID=UPI00047988D0|nr:pseudouridine-5'-phosphate glycosidase [Fodinicurvata fenggangensis]